MAAQEFSDIKGIIFDCFGVLYVGSLQMLYDITPKDKWEQLHDLNVGSDYGYIDQNQYATSLAEITGRTPEEVIELRSREHVRNDAVVEYVRELKKTYKIAMLSNVGPNLIERLFTEAERAELFDTVVLSSTEGIVKPHPEIFRLTAERLGFDPGECLMIDDLEKNIEGADAAGMRGIVFVNLDNLKDELKEHGVAA